MAAVKRFFRRWHGTIAWWVSPAVMVVVITGGVLAFRGYLKTPEPEATEVAAGAILTLDQAVERAQRHADLDAQAIEIYVATDPEGTWCVVFDYDDDTEVYMAAEGEVRTPLPCLSLISTSEPWWWAHAGAAAPDGRAGRRAPGPS